MSERPIQFWFRGAIRQVEGAAPTRSLLDWLRDLLDAVLLEPVMAVEVVVPQDFTGSVVSDLNGRRGRVMGLEPAPGSTGSSGGAQIVKAEVPLAEMVGYATALRSATQGRASYTMHYSHNAEVSAASASGSSKISSSGLSGRMGARVR